MFSLVFLTKLKSVPLKIYVGCKSKKISRKKLPRKDKII
ncbi:hypothetical protein CULT_2480006 [[Clostridium] ultunense Esp]|nr:hypothetical protein CULT_2480006 [[Clostridium] ultunense Esp]